LGLSRASDKIEGLKSWWPTNLACLYWLPLLGMYSFGRLSELCYLRVCDVDVKERLLIICETDQRGLKTPGSERKVPVHPELIRLGFLRYVAEMERQGAELLFPDLRARGANTPLGDLFATLWNFVLDGALPAARASKKTFHSLRDAGNTIMINQKVLDPIREALLGHEGKTTNTKIYGHDIEIATLRSTIDAFPSMTDHLHPIF
jgi:integrase